MTTTDVDDRKGEAEEGQDEKQRLALEVKIDKPSACERHVTVTVAREDIDAVSQGCVQRADAQGRAAWLPSRPRPRKLVESRFKEHVADQVKGKILMDSLSQMSDDHQFTAISEPDFDMDSVQLPDDGPMVFEFDIEVRPEFDMPRWKGLTLERPGARILAMPKSTSGSKQLLARSMVSSSSTKGRSREGDFVTVTLRTSLRRPAALAAHRRDDRGQADAELAATPSSKASTSC